MIKRKYIEPAFTLMTRATSNLWATWEGCYFTCIGCIGQLLFMCPVCSLLTDKPRSGSLSQVLSYSALIQMTPHLLVVYCTIQVLPPLPGFNGVHGKVGCHSTTTYFMFFPVIPYLVFFLQIPSAELDRGLWAPAWKLSSFSHTVTFGC